MEPDSPGARASCMLVGKSALGLSRLHTVDEKIAKDNLAAIMKDLDAYLAKHDDDKVVRWLKGRAQIMEGSRRDGAGTIARAAAGDDGYVIAIIDQADALVDERHARQGALDLLPALKKSRGPPAGDPRARARSGPRRASRSRSALNDLNDKFVDGKTPPRVTAYRSLARTLGTLQTESSTARPRAS